MGCLYENEAIIAHVLLLIDVVTCIIFGYYTPKGTALNFSIFILYINLFTLLVISFLQLLGAQVEWTYELAGISVGAVVGIMQLFACEAVLVELVVSVALIVAAQLSSTYLPPLLQSSYGLPLTTGAAISLLVPVAMIIIIKFALQMKAVLLLWLCVAFALLCALAESVYRHSPIVFAEICCDLSDSDNCVIFPSTYEFVVFGTVFAGLLSITVYRYMDEFTQWVKSNPCACFCCCCRKRKSVTNDTNLKPTKIVK